MADIRTFIVAPTADARASLESLLGPGELPLAVVVGESEALPEDAASLRDAEVILAAGGETLGAAPPEGYPSLAFVLLTDDGGRAVSWLRAASPFGWGILAPDATPEEVGSAILAAANGLAVLPREFAEEMAEEMPEAGETEAPPEPLTAREREVLGLLAKGIANKEIARELYISEHTVKFHLSSIFAKLDVSSRAGAVSRGAHFGLVSL